MQKIIFELERACKRGDWEMQKYNCAVSVELFRLHGNKGYGRGALRAALRYGKRYARLARKYA